MKGKKEKIRIDMVDSYLHTRSVFANMKFGNCGPHKSMKDYDRKANKRADRKIFRDYI